MARILIVDDALITRKNLKAILTKAGHTIVGEALNGKQAYTEYEKHRPDLVTMDITMPVVNGIDAVKNITASFPDAKIIVISALDQRKMIFDALESGAKHYITKPVTNEKVLSVVNLVLENSDIPTEPVVESTPKQEDAPLPLPFMIENKNGAYMVNINRSINHDDFQYLFKSLNDLLFTRPFKVILNFGDIEVLDDEIFERVVKIVNNFKKVSIKMVIASQSKRFLDYIASRNISVTTNYYSDVSSIEM